MPFAETRIARRRPSSNGAIRRPRPPLVLAARVQAREDHQIGVAKQPVFGAFAGNERRGQSAQVLLVGYSTQVLPANTCQINNFRFCEELLAGSNSYHGPSSGNDP